MDHIRSFFERTGTVKTAMISVLVIGLTVLVGCDAKSTPGGPGVTKTNSGSGPAGITLGTPENTFRLDPPKLETTLKQGETKEITIGISRGTNFDQDVKLEFGEAPKGLKFTPSNPVIKAGDKNVQVSVAVAKDAALGHHVVSLIGTPMKEGAKTSASLKLEIKKAE
jgi:hypothetical protein